MRARPGFVYHQARCSGVGVGTSFSKLLCDGAAGFEGRRWRCRPGAAALCHGRKGTCGGGNCLLVACGKLIRQRPCLQWSGGGSVRRHQVCGVLRLCVGANELDVRWLNLWRVVYVVGSVAAGRARISQVTTQYIHNGRVAPPLPPAACCRSGHVLQHIRACVPRCEVSPGLPMAEPTPDMATRHYGASPRRTCIHRQRMCIDHSALAMASISPGIPRAG